MRARRTRQEKRDSRIAGELTMELDKRQERPYGGNHNQRRSRRGKQSR